MKKKKMIKIKALERENFAKTNHKKAIEQSNQERNQPGL